MSGGATEQRLADLRKEYEKIIEDAMKERDQLASATGYEIGATDEQKATYGGFETMSEDTGSELNGRFTALQMAGEEIKNQMISSVVALNALVTSAGTGNRLLSDILTQHAITNAYLEDIVKYSKTAAGYGAKLDKIVEQTKNL
jgi:formate-dependent nitrite reductase cytochrome c552 subunit